jgi:oligopeptide/dipeptide ABC transporter ATP-binding protein
LLRRSIQIVFQDPYASLNPRMSAGAIVSEPLRIYGIGTETERRERTIDLLHSVGLSAADTSAYPHELSGGQRQRVAIARAIALDPAVVVCDEPVSSLDVSIQAQVLALLHELKEKLGLAYLFISHDLAVVNQVADYVSVMYLGKIVETGSRDNVLRQTAHPYTRALLSAHPTRAGQEGAQSVIVRGEPPSPTDPPSGCRFRTRCWKATALCASDEPPLRVISEAHAVACHFPETPSVPSSGKVPPV